MLEELLKHDNLGNKRELAFLLFQALIPGKVQRLSDVIRFCTSNIFSISRSINGIVCLFDFLSIIEVKDDKILLNQKVFDPKDFTSSNDYFLNQHFYKCLLNKLNSEYSKTNLFNEDNLKFSKDSGQYFVKSNLINLDLFPIRNLLIALNFLEQDQIVPDYLYISTNFTDFFKKIVINKLEGKSESKKITLEQLKQNIEAKDEIGKQGELFVIQHEKFRLKGHPNFEKIIRISEEHANAGYDIQSFNGLDSIVPDRFIEVKSYKDEIAFYWSKNEVEKAKTLTTKYYLYLVDRSKSSNDNYEPKIIQDPYKKIFNNEYWKKEIENWKITLEI